MSNFWNGLDDLDSEFDFEFCFIDGLNTDERL